MARRGRKSMAEELIMAPWWVSVVVCLIGNIVIWGILPRYFEVNSKGGILVGALPAGYTGAKPILSQIFNLVMLIVFAFSLLYNFMRKKKT